MPRLTALKPRVAFVRQRIQSHNVERIRGRANQRRRERILSERPLCVHCEAQGRTSAATEVDHIVPLWQGGSEDDSNLQPLCAECHNVKTVAEAQQRAGGGEIFGGK